MDDNNNRLLEAVQNRTAEEQRIISSNAGKASGAARRRKRDMKKAMLHMLNEPIANNDIYNLTGAMGVDVNEMTYQSAVIAAMIREAALGNVKAFHEICALIGAGNEGERIALLREDHKLRQIELERKAEEKEITEGTGVMLLAPVLQKNEEETE